MLGLYIHIPFCVQKCFYCGFYSTQYDNIIADEYLSAILVEIGMHSHILSKQTIESIYIGGGTPTTLSQDQFCTLFNLIKEHVQLSEDAEITVEANPNTVTADSLLLLKRLGVTRLSIGVQSFSNELLTRLGRVHTANQAVSAMHGARDAGFGNIAIDLIFGVPGQTEAQWRNTLETAVSLNPKHISAYCLSLDEGSQWYRDEKVGIGEQTNDDISATMYGTAIEFLRSFGYQQYEISNFCMSGYECRHNVNYWDRGEYLGLGPGAWSFIGNKRWANIVNVGQYVVRLREGITVQDKDRVEFVNREQAAREKLFLGLRKTSGVDLATYGSLFGAEALDALIENIAGLERDGLVDRQKETLVLTGRGMLLSNEVLSRIIT
jgi:oxygen-independent coproporphyrinogen III oxidase